MMHNNMGRAMQSDNMGARLSLLKDAKSPAKTTKARTGVPNSTGIYSYPVPDSWPLRMNSWKTKMDVNHDAIVLTITPTMKPIIFFVLSFIFLRATVVLS
jgi:hypothetical protein